MKEDDVLESLAAVRDHLRAERADDAALEAVARGDLGSDAAADIERRAASDPGLAALVAASRPLGAEVEARIAARIRPRASARGGRVVALIRRTAPYAAPLAVAAALLVYLGRGDAGHPSLPEYTVVATSEREMRGAGEERARLELRGGDDATFEIVARPATTAAAHVAAYVFAIGVSGTGEASPVDARVDVAAEGSVRIRGRARALDGARELRVVLGAASDFKRYEDALSRAHDGKSDDRVRVLVVPLVRVPHAAP